MRARVRELLIEARLAKGMTQTELSRALGRPQSYVSNYERGQRRVEVADLILIARVLDVEPTELLGRLVEGG